MKVLFVRHGIAADRMNFDGNDVDRPLTEEGVRKARKVFLAVAKLFPEIELVISSEAVRARQTAEVLVEAFNKGKPELQQSALLNPGADYRSFRKLMKEIGFKRAGIAVVGHEPDFGHMIAGVTSEGRLRIDVKKASCIVVDINSLCRGELSMAVPPKIMKKIRVD